MKQRSISLNSRFFPAVLVAVSTFLIQTAAANGINRGGIGALSMGRGGVAVSAIDDPFAGMSVNPALLGYIIHSDFSASVTGITAYGEFQSRFTSGGLDENTGIIPEMVLRFPLTRASGLGFSIVPEQAALVDWTYLDGRGGIDGNTSYGIREHRSYTSGVRASAGLGIRITDSFSMGVSVGALYNQNELASPYTFQTHPALAGFKTLLDLQTEGTGLNADIGFLWEASERLTLGLSYRSPTRIHSTGTATGDLSAQFDSLGLSGIPSEFRYDATVVNQIPDQLTVGGTLRISDNTSLLGEVEWIRWEDSFKSLEVDLSDGSNSSINGLLGSNNILDTIPLHWENRAVLRVGMEHQLSPLWSLRAGYQYGKSPVPEATILPMTAAIFEHTISLGVSWDRDPYSISLAYQHDLPSHETIGESQILSGEYDGTGIKLEAHRLALSVSYDF